MARRRTRPSFVDRVDRPQEPLIGRERCCVAVEELVAGGASIVTLTGPGGAGKSRVAREVGRRIDAATARTADVVTCELADVHDDSGLLKAVARAAGVSAPTSRGAKAFETLAHRLAAASRETAIVLLLDDADAVVGSVVALVKACLDAGAAMRFLVTSREALGMAGERRYEIGPLDAASARALFEANAEGGSWSADELSALIEQLDGLPLAIELAARRSRLVPPGDLLAKIEDRFRLLKTDRRDVAARHVTLSATIEWSLARLEVDESRAFVACAAFEGTFTLEAFEAVVGPELAGDPLDVVEALLRKSLFAALETSAAVRFTMLRSVRAFAELELAAGAADRRQALELRHARYYVERAEAAAAGAYGASAEQALDTIEADLPEVVRAFERSKARWPELAARAVIASGDLVLLRNSLDLRSAIFREARAAADASGDDRLRVQARVVEAKVILEVGAAADAEALLVEALAIAKKARLDDAADVQRSLAWARIALGDAPGALGEIEEALASHRSKRNVRGEADALVARGLVRCLAGDRPSGESDLENAHALHVMSGDSLRREKVREVAAMVGLALVEEGEPGDEAARDARAAHLRAAAEAHRASGRTWRETIARVQLEALEGADAKRPPPAATAAAEARAADLWSVGPDARSLRRPDGHEIDLARHAALRLVLDALVTKRLAEPGVALSADALLDAGWPGERVRHDSGMLRVYSVIRRIRALGLADALLTRDDGYLLDPAVRVERIVALV